MSTHASAESRELITLGGGGVLLHGTYHKAGPNAFGSTMNIGVMFLNALSTPRSLMGDSGIYWATSFAAHGFPSFRFDLPGLGDSYGEIPNDVLNFTNKGGWATIASFKLEELVVKEIEGTDHSFSNRAGRIAVRQHSENWLSKHFPVAKKQAPPSRDVKFQSMETIPITVGAGVPACVSSEE